MNEEVRQMSENRTTMNEEVRQRYEGTLPMNEGVRHLSEICPNGGRHLHGSALLTDGSAPPMNDNVRPEYDIAWQMDSALPRNGQRSSMLGSAFLRRDNCTGRGQSPVFDSQDHAFISNASQGQLMVNPIDMRFSVKGLHARLGRGCLLYTSPSPRD